MCHVYKLRKARDGQKHRKLGERPRFSPGTFREHRAADTWVLEFRPAEPGEGTFLLL